MPDSSLPEPDAKEAAQPSQVGSAAKAQPVSLSAATGGSAAAQAFIQQQADAGRTDASKPAVPSATTAAPKEGVDARGAKRVKVSGRARVMLGRMAGATGKLIDMSETGLGLLMEDMPPAKLVTAVQCDVFHNGKRHVFGVPAMCVYGVLASGKGFKVGLQFVGLDPAVKKVVAELMV